MAMRVRCNQCGGLGVISKSDLISENVSRLYCRCKSDTCGHAWVSTLAHSHTTRPSSKQGHSVAIALIDALSPEALTKIIEELTKLNKCSNSNN
ncbi:ogr/Delta-like zinc finger family protein [Aeromonas jandaei]